ncbi:MAG: DUF86 domain-containing protein [Nanoarchaeota archaeon]
MKKDNRIFIEHILNSIEKIEEFLENKSKEDFFNDEQLHEAVARKLEIVGEATKNITKDFREKHAEIPWRKIAGLRDVLIHEYFGIDLTITWGIIKKDLPNLKEKIKNILSQLKDKK